MNINASFCRKETSESIEIWYDEMKPSVLIVDDNELICFSLERLLSEEYITYTAFNGREGLDILRRNSTIDIVLTDIMMPVMDGIEMIEKLRSENKDVIVIAITAVYSGEIVSEVIEKGANQCIMKPFDIPELKMTLKRLFEQKKAKRTNPPN